MLHDIILPEFSPSTRVTNIQAYVFTTNCDYDIIFGRDFLRLINMSQDFSSGSMTAFDITVPMKTKHFYHNPFASLALILDSHENEENFAIEIKASKYEKVDVKEVVRKQIHLTRQQQDDLLVIFEDRTKLFSGKLGKYPHKKMDLELEPNAKPIHSRPYPIARPHLKVFSNELDRLVELGVLSRIGATEWASPTFIIPKKDG